MTLVETWDILCDCDKVLGHEPKRCHDIFAGDSGVEAVDLAAEAAAGGWVQVVKDGEEYHLCPVCSKEYQEKKKNGK